MNPYLLADDLSGALEAGAAFRAGGTPVTLTFNPADPVAPDGLRVLSSETRNMRPSAAAGEISRLLAAQRAAGGRLLLKKIDSTLRGPVGGEVKALIETLAPPLVVVCPANPTVGRTVRDGRLFVHGMPVAYTEFQHDPGSPVTESRVAAVLAAGGVGPITSLPLAELRSLGALGPAHKRGVLVSDAETREDLAHLVQLVRQGEPGAVFVGSGGLAHALAAGRGSSPPARWTAPRNVLIVCGSMRGQSRQQLEVLRDRHAVPLHEVGPEPAGVGQVAASLTRALAQRGAASLAVARNFSVSDPTAPLQLLAAVVNQLVAAGVELEMLAATGGDTARALCAALAVDRLELEGEVEPEVVITRIPRHVRCGLRGMIIKPGGFGSDAVWVDIVPLKAR